MNHLRYQYATGSSAIATTLAPGENFRLIQVRIHLSAVGASGNFTMTMDAGQGAAYDLLMVTQDMTSVTDYIWEPDIPMPFEKTDEIDFAWANAGGKTYGLTIVYELI